MAFFRRGTARLGRTATPVRLDPSYGDPRVAALRAAAARGDWPEIRQGLLAAADEQDLAWLVLGTASVEGTEGWISAAAAAEPESSVALLLSGARHIEWAWEARTAKRAQHVSREQFAVFHERLRIAEEQLYEVAEREPGWSAPWYFLQITGRGLQVGQAAAERRFEAAVRRAPGHPGAHRQQLQQICKKWGGSFERMHAFARGAMLDSPEGGPLGELVAIAHLEQWAELPRGEDAAYIRRSQVAVELHEAAERSVRHPDFVRHRDWTRAFNTFALAFALSGENDSAAELFRVLDGSATEFPWNYVDADPVAGFRNWRSRVGA